MENLTHSLVGAALADVALPNDATRAQRTIFLTAGVLGANLPDGDLFYSNIMSSPIGYLLQHRGYTHTIVGCLVLACFVGAFGFIPAIRDRLGATRRRWWMFVVVALLSHITLDWWNSYGVHPFWPFDNRWVYGDAINIFEPLLWVMLGMVVAMNRIHIVSRIGVFLLVAGGALGIAVVGLIPFSAAIVAEALGGVLLIALWRVSRRTRAATSLALSLVFVVAMFGLNRVARGEVVRTWQHSPNGAIVDIVLSPAAANPLCWSALTIERDAGNDTYTLRRGRVSLFSGKSLENDACENRRRPKLNRSRAFGNFGATIVAWRRGFSSAARRRSRTHTSSTIDLAGAISRTCRSPMAKFRVRAISHRGVRRARIYWGHPDGGAAAGGPACVTPSPRNRGTAWLTRSRGGDGENTKTEKCFGVFLVRRGSEVLRILRGSA